MEATPDASSADIARLQHAIEEIDEEMEEIRAWLRLPALRRIYARPDLLVDVLREHETQRAALVGQLAALELERDQAPDQLSTPQGVRAACRDIASPTATTTT